MKMKTQREVVYRHEVYQFWHFKDVHLHRQSSCVLILGNWSWTCVFFLSFYYYRNVIHVQMTLSISVSDAIICYFIKKHSCYRKCFYLNKWFWVRAHFDCSWLYLSSGIYNYMEFGKLFCFNKKRFLNVKESGSRASDQPPILPILQQKRPC